MENFSPEWVILDIAAMTQSFGEAAQKLQDAVLGYLEVALIGDPPNGLAPRPSPLSRRIMWHALCLISAFRDHKRRFRVYDFQVPANCYS